MKINYITSPEIKPRISESVIKGLNHFIKDKMNLSPVNNQEDWKSIDSHRDFFERRKKDLRKKHLNLILTHRNQERFIEIKDEKQTNIALSLKHIQNSSQAFILGYNILANHYSNCYCTNEHCTHIIHNTKELETLSLLYQMNKQIPLCDYHKKWRY